MQMKILSLQNGIKRLGNVYFHDSRPLFIILLMLFVGYQIHIIHTQSQDVHSLVRWDSAAYTAALVQGEDDDALSRDTVYANHKFADSAWFTSSIYMHSLRLFHTIAGEDIYITFALYRVFILILYVPSMYLFVWQVLDHKLLALLLALLSAFPHIGTITNSVWGVPTRLDQYPIIPETLYTPFGVLLAWLVYRYWLKPGANQQRISSWHVVSIGLLTSASLYLFHSISGLNVIELLILLSLVQSMRRKLPYWSVVVFGVATLPLLFARIFFASGVPESLSQAGARIVMDSGNFFMVFPWEGRWIQTSIGKQGVITLRAILLFFFGGYLTISIASGWFAIRTSRFQKAAKLIFVITQTVYCLFFLAFGWVPLLLLAYGARRILTDTDDELDHTLLIALVLANLIGPIQQTAIYYFWEWVEIPSLVGLIYEMARFQRFVYVPLYLLLGRAILLFSTQPKRQLEQIGVGTVLGWLVFKSIGLMPVGFVSLTSAHWVILVFLVVWVAFYDRVTLGATFVRQSVMWEAELVRLRDDHILRKFLDILALYFVRPRLGILAFLAFFPLWELKSEAFAHFYLIEEGNDTLLAIAGLVLILITFSQASGRIRWAICGVVTTVIVASIVFFLPWQFILAKHIVKNTIIESLSYLQEEVHNDVHSMNSTTSSRMALDKSQDYLDMTTWVRENTPYTSLFHLWDLNSNFRYFARRSILIGYSDVSFGVYTDIDPVFLKNIADSARDIAQSEELLCFLGNRQVDYLVSDTSPEYSSRETIVCEQYRGQLIFENNSYRIYRIERETQGWVLPRKLLDK